MSRYEGAWNMPAVRVQRLGLGQDVLKVRAENGFLRRGSLNRRIPEDQSELWKLLTNDFEFSEEVAEGIMKELGVGEEVKAEI